MVYVVIALVYAVCMAICYYKVIDSWELMPFDRAWVSFFWPVLLPLYVIHYLHNKKW